MAVKISVHQTRRKFSESLWIAHIDLKSAFDSVDRESLWLLLRRRGIPNKIVELLEELYTDTCSCVMTDRMCSVCGSMSSVQCVKVALLLLIFS